MATNKTTAATFAPKSLVFRGADEARKHASANGGLPGVFFQSFGASPGTNRGHGPAAFRWRLMPGPDGEPPKVQVIALGDEARRLLMAHLDDLMRSFGADDFEVRPIAMSIELSDRLGLLRFARLSIQSSHVGQRFSGRALARPTTVEELAARCGGIDALNERVIEVLQSGISKLAGELGLPIPDMDEWVFADPKIESKGVLPLGGAFHHCTVSGQIHTNLKLTGLWNIGRGASKGAGRIFNLHSYAC